ncbi:hypothetical protein [Streptomyces sp. NBC_00658]|uniref:hypothetical protein n=1 Tax=Streptomyces sp. NBC_00658 TaxID=2975800 RepID=UPI003252DAA2
MTDDQHHRTNDDTLAHLLQDAEAAVDIDPGSLQQRKHASLFRARAKRSESSMVFGRPPRLPVFAAVTRPSRVFSRM